MATVSGTMSAMRAVGVMLLLAGAALSGTGCETKVTAISAVGLDKNDRPVNRKIVVKDEKGNVVKEAKPMKSVRVGFDDQGKVRQVEDLAERTTKSMPKVDPFARLTVDDLKVMEQRNKAAAATRRAAEDGTEVVVEEAPKSRVLSKLVFQGWAGRGQPPVHAVGGWGRGTELLPPQELQPGKATTLTLGDPMKSGGQVEYEVSEPDRRNRVPIRLTLTLWGQRSLRRTWTALLAPGQAQNFEMTTRQGEQVKMEVVLESLEGVEAGEAAVIRKYDKDGKEVR